MNFLMDLNVYNTSRKHLFSLFLTLIRHFIALLNLRGNSMYVLSHNGLKIHVFSTYRFNYPTRSFINPIIDSVKNFLKKFIKITFKINHCFSGRIKINRSKFYVSNFYVFLTKLLRFFDI